jgi:MoaA/NifB/PqqE/SkfB family radical SAM enzyme
VHVDLVNACNTACLSCWHHSPLRPRAEADWQRRRFSLQRFSRLLDELEALGGLEQLILSGMGEPTLHPELPELVARVARLGVAREQQALGEQAKKALLCVITNGLWERSSWLSQGLRLELLVSLCAWDRESWLRFHAGTPPDGFERVQRNVAAALELGHQVKLVQVIHHEHHHGLVEMVKLAKAWGVGQCSFKLASLDDATRDLAMSPEQRRECLQRHLPRARGVALALGVKTDLEGFEAQLQSADDAGRIAPIEDIGCHLGQRYARVDVDATVYFCCNTNLAIGSLDEHGFAELWQGHRWWTLRESLARGQFFEGCERCGKVKQNLKLAKAARAAARIAQAHSGSE